jgi:hypothetical protein
MKTSSLSVEPLEVRIAPAAVFTYVEDDGDNVVIRTSKGSNDDLAAVLTVVSGQLTLLNLSANAVFAGTSLSIIAKRGFVAQQIGSFKIGTTAFSLTAGAGNDLDGLLAGLTVDLRVREVAVP